MRIHHNSISPTKSTQITSKSQISGEKKAFLQKAQKKNSAEADSALIAKAELMSLADALKTGKIDQNEASARFVGSVVQTSLKDKLSESDRERIIKEISEFCQDDVEFVKNLEKNLMNLV